MLRLATILTASVLVIGCGSSGFSGAGKSEGKDSAKAKAEPQPEPEKTAAKPSPEAAAPTPPAPVSPDPGEVAAEEDAAAPKPPAAIVACAKAWADKKPPFTAAELAKPTLVTVDQSNNNNALTHSDTTKTDKPKLVQIDITSKNINSGRLELLNPNGWYCVDVQSKAANNFTIKLACKATVATLSHTSHTENGFTIEREQPCP